MIESEIKLIEAISQAKVVAIALSHENLLTQQVQRIVEDYEQQFQLPTADVLSHGCQKLIQALIHRFPSLDKTARQISARIPVLAR
jgi:uncharacterized NAD-dependent epimerase/dehydratase family protein